MSGTSPAGLVDRIRCHLVGLKMPRALEVLDHVLRRLECGEIGAPEALEALLGVDPTATLVANSFPSGLTSRSGA